MKNRIRHYLAYLLTALIALQSVVTVADVHQYHQSGTEHLSFDHEHTIADLGSAKGTKMKPVDGASKNPFDCHHCCHCHGMAHFFVINSQEPHTDRLPVMVLVDYEFTYTSYWGSLDTPPPIS